MNQDELLHQLRSLYDQVDRQAGQIRFLLGDAMKCGRGCTECCLDDLSALVVEAELIRRDFPGILSQQAPGPVGACAFLDPGGLCRIYPVRPYICRTQGLPLRWFDTKPDGEIAQFRDICPVNDPELDLPLLPDEQCFLLGPFEERLQALMEQWPGGPQERIELRRLFDYPDR